MKLFKLIIAAVFIPFTAMAQQSHHGHASPYAGEEMRQIKSFSAEEIAELKRGAGLGFAKAAELNGIPGPSHVLEMKQQLGLTLSQSEAVQKLFERMRRAAVHQGEQLISLEEELEAGFQARSMDEVELRKRLNQIEDGRANLRFIHLSAHLEMTKLLDHRQIEKYNELRGYAAR